MTLIDTATAGDQRCFHCSEPIPASADYTLEISRRMQSFCCPGCLAVAELIDSHGLERFYDYRSAPAMRPADEEASSDKWTVCDRPEVAARLCHRADDNTSELRCTISGVNCAACCWLIDRGLRELDGIYEVSVNPVTAEALIRFDPQKQQPSMILSRIAEFGFDPHPSFQGGRRAEGVNGTRNDLKRLAVAGLGFAQVMTLSAALYLGALKSMEASFQSFFVYASLLVATPVVLYAGAPIFRSAWISLSQRRLGMDVPVSLAILAALGASVLNAFRGTGHVYFDSATMFVFFLTLGRFLESRARHRAGSLFSALTELVPISARRRQGDLIEEVGTIELGVGDTVVVSPGDAVPTDGELVSEQGLFDESLLSGESLGRKRLAGESLLGGSLNVGSNPVEVVVRRIGGDTYVERVGSMLQAAMTDRPRFLELADRWAAWFVASVLVLTAVVGAWWLSAAPERAFQIVLSMLIVTCPCALSLAAPTAYTVALARLARRGLLLRSARALERLGSIGTWLFDKTGTLTKGALRVVSVETYGQPGRDDCLATIAALEAGVGHPVARALAGPASNTQVTEQQTVPGFGVTGIVDGKRYRIGSARFVRTTESRPSSGPIVYLASDNELLARIELADEIRPHAKEAVETLRRTGHEVVLVSGDAPAPVSEAALRLGITEHYSEQAPDEKLALLSMRQAKGDVVAAVGDGINDAPLLAQADVSVAMMSGSQLAQASADIVCTTSDLRELADLPERARETRRIVRQNLCWAAAYNLVAVPLAAAGLVAPWMAAIGMSLSSLIVVGNALRLGPRLDTPLRSARDPIEPVFAPDPETT